MLYFKSYWNESRGDKHDDWGKSWWYFEVADDGYVVRQIEQYANGTCLTYDHSHIEDKFGGLSEKPFEPKELKQFHAISEAEFKTTWSSVQPLNRNSG
jgi:hypothetical protein